MAIRSPIISGIKVAINIVANAGNDPVANCGIITAISQTIFPVACISKTGANLTGNRIPIIDIIAYPNITLGT